MHSIDELIKIATQRDAEFRKSQLEVSKNHVKDEWNKMSKYYAGKIDDNSFWLSELKDLRASQQKEGGASVEKELRLFYIDEVRKLLHLFDTEEISFSRFVEMLNEKATGLSASEITRLKMARSTLPSPPQSSLNKG